MLIHDNPDLSRDLKRMRIGADRKIANSRGWVLRKSKDTWLLWRIGSTETHSRTATQAVDDIRYFVRHGKFPVEDDALCLY